MPNSRNGEEAAAAAVVEEVVVLEARRVILVHPAPLEGPPVAHLEARDRPVVQGQYPHLLPVLVLVLVLAGGVRLVLLGLRLLPGVLHHLREVALQGQFHLFGVPGRLGPVVS